MISLLVGFCWVSVMFVAVAWYPDGMPLPLYLVACFVIAFRYFADFWEHVR